MRRQKWLRIIAINDCYELSNLPRLRTLYKVLQDTPHLNNKLNDLDVPDKTIVTLAGDFLSPSLLSSLDRGRGMIDVLNHVPITHVSFGNHEADLPLEAVRQRTNEFLGSWLNTNMPNFEKDHNHKDEKDQNKTTTQTYDVIDLGDGIKVGIVGLISDAPGVFSTDTFRGVQIDDVAQSTLDAVECMQRSLGKQPHNQLAAVIPLTHQSVCDDERLAMNLLEHCPVPVPFIFGGHEHSLIMKSFTRQTCNNNNNNNIQLIKTGSDATHAVVADLVLSLSTDNNTVSSATHTAVIDLSKFEQDATLLTLCNEHEKAIALMKKEVIIDFTEHAILLSSENARKQQTSMGGIFASACRSELQTDCAMLNGGPIKGERVYPTSTLSYAELQNELPFPTKMVSVTMDGRTLAASILASRTGAEERGYLQLCDEMEVDQNDTNVLVKVQGKCLDLEQLYTVALPRNILAGFCAIQPLVEFGKELELNSYVPALNLVVAYFAKDLWKRLGSFDELDLNSDGEISADEIALVYEKQHGFKISQPLLKNLISAFDTDKSGAVSKLEFERTMSRKFGSQEE
jgi:2',3'-cyclic-nucleotide 2'-phosphodiesterase (5'-nucleotidase family)